MSGMSDLYKILRQSRLDEDGMSEYKDTYSEFREFNSSLKKGEYPLTEHLGPTLIITKNKCSETGNTPYLFNEFEGDIIDQAAMDKDKEKIGHIEGTRNVGKEGETDKTIITEITFDGSENDKIETTGDIAKSVSTLLQKVKDYYGIED